MLRAITSMLAATATTTTTTNSTPVKQDICNVLSFSGGGSFGAVELGMLDALVSSGAVPNHYDILTGISAGGLNAGFLSYYTNISDGLAAVYPIITGLTTSAVYESAYLDVLSDWSIYSTKPLEATLSGVITGKQPQPGAPITLVGATNVNSATLDVFRYDLQPDADKLNTLMATSAIPLAFPPRIINGTVYVDGGVINNEMLTQAMGELPCSFYNFVFISASGRSGYRPVTGLLSYVAAVGHVLLDTFDYQLAQFENVYCAYPKGAIQACFPTAPELADYSILNFDNGATLWELGGSAYNCTKLQVC
jgi:hypothetical protein